MVTIQEIKDLRIKTGVSYMDCLHALATCDDDVEVAAEFLKLKGQAFARHLDDAGYIALAKKNLGEKYGR